VGWRLSTMKSDVDYESAKLHEPDIRPLSRLQNAESQATYARYMQRLVCYSMRVYKNWESQEGEERQGQDRSRGEDKAAGWNPNHVTFRIGFLTCSRDLNHSSHV